MDKVIIEKIREKFEVIEETTSNATYIISDIEDIAKEDFINKINIRAGRIENEIKEIKRLMHISNIK